jgi:integrase
MSRKGENIYKRKDGRWEARYIISHDENGHAKYRSVYAKSYTEVKKKRQDALLKLSGMDYENQPKAGTVESVSRAWIKDCTHKWKESTRCRYQEKLGIYILPYFGKRELSDISTAEVESFISMLQTEGMPGRDPVSAGTARSVLTVMKQIRLHALKMDHQVRFNPECIIVRAQKADISVFSEAEEKRLVAHLSENTDETDAGFLTCLFTGIRVGELCALNCDNIDLEDGVIHIRATMQRLPDHSGGEKKTKVTIDRPKSECSVRDIPINKELLEVLRRFHKPGAFLLTGDTKRFVEPKTMENRFKSILKKCGLKPVGVHTCRHSFSCRCIERGMDPKTLSEILGHANVATTLNTYVHSTRKRKEEGLNMLSDLFSV